MIRVVLADDQAMVRAGFRMILEAADDIEVVAEAENGLQAEELVERLHPGLVLMDIQMPVLDGLGATRRIIERPHSTTRVLILTTFERDEYVFEALRCGASGFLLKNAPPEELVHAVRVVAGGDALLSPSVTRRIIEQFTRLRASTVSAKELERLTER
ncbi:MAG: response regulator transcription factor, partial [Acidimicrobiales bacterium]